MAKNVEATVEVTAESIIAQYGNKSKAIRALDASGMKRGDIAKLLGIRYQHVRNVLITPVKTQEKTEA